MLGLLERRPDLPPSFEEQFNAAAATAEAAERACAAALADLDLSTEQMFSIRMAVQRDIERLDELERATSEAFIDYQERASKMRAALGL
ncbi:hypothetical protein [Kineococcus esterisolvens]|uniref:hypothetical protein n=1 Tax=unclassified Kineococcus TaxID=2621656 RepID=UPI003D7DD9C1